MAKIYTRHGDQGMTSLVGGTRLPKSHPRLHAYGTLDELNVCIGLTLSQLTDTINPNNQTKNILLRIQNELFIAGGLLACDDPKWLSQLPTLKETMINQLEIEIDQWTQTLPPLKNFILPGGHPSALHAHVARTVCRRAERWTLTVLEENPSAVNELILKYLNRLSDHLFTLSRWFNHTLNQTETPWIPA